MPKSVGICCAGWAYPGPRSNHVKLYVNGNYFGLYINVEHVDEEFVQLRYGNNDGNLYKCLWPADLAYKGGDPDLYKQEYGGRRAYELVTNEINDDYTDLAHFIDVLNNTPIADLPCELEKVFNVDSYLKAIAFDILDGNWDGPIYNKNNFYLYHNLATDKFEYIPYDLDNTLGIDWLSVDWVTRNIYTWAPSTEPRPIYKRLIAVPEYKDRFSFYMNGYLQTVFHPDSIFPYLDNLKALISDAAQIDPYRPLDYGFSFDDFEDGWDSALPWFQTPTGVKPFIQGRWQTASQQLLMGDISPIIHQVSHAFWPSAMGLQINASATDDNLTAGMEVCYRWNGQTQTCLDLFDDGQHADGAAGDGGYGNSLDFAGQTGEFEYFVRATDNVGQQSRQPICDWRTVYVGDAVAPLVLNEFMASNSGTYPDGAGEFEDWIEVYNPSNAPLSLKDFYLTDNEDLPGKWKMPNVYIPTQGYTVFWADSDESQGSLHTNFKLSAEGEYLAIHEKRGDGFTLVDSYTFGEQAPTKSRAACPTALVISSKCLRRPAQTTSHLRQFGRSASMILTSESRQIQRLTN
ncbi:MAG: CotH kinase family protein [Saprospiraceae bacterium]|nr:CotH kinase family protein [Saprospiraceae bacterium]